MQPEKLDGKIDCKDGTFLFAVLCISSYWLLWSSRAGYFLLAQNTCFLGVLSKFVPTLVFFTVVSHLRSIYLNGKYFCNSKRQQDLENGLIFNNVFHICHPQDVKKMLTLFQALLCIPLQLITEGRQVVIKFMIKSKIGLLVVRYLYIWLKYLGLYWLVMCNWWCNHSVLMCFGISAFQAAEILLWA